MKKVDYEGTLNDLYDNDLQTFIDYNIRDVKILVELDKKLNFIELQVLLILDIYLMKMLICQVVG